MPRCSEQRCRCCEMLLAHPCVTDDPARVRFAGFADIAMNVEIVA